MTENTGKIVFMKCEKCGYEEEVHASENHDQSNGMIKYVSVMPLAIFVGCL